MQPTFETKSQRYVIDLSLCTFRSKNKRAQYKINPNLFLLSSESTFDEV